MSYHGPEITAGHFNRLPHASEVFPYLDEHPLHDTLVEKLRAVFLQHGTWQSFGLSTVHRHFDLTPQERLVEYHSIATPWEEPKHLADVDGHILPANWTYLDGVLTSYEYRFTTTSEMERGPVPTLPTSFVESLYDMLREHGLESRYGIALLPEGAHDPSNPPRLEFTAGRANVTVPYSSAMEEKMAAKMLYLFPCIDPLLDAEYDGPRMRHCVVCVKC
ncbi:hypothetical protein GGR55DRAFT_674128 [Xylaria sp. FL0064]|nr:hypothetical protein GGR55DRAFT_674128 [Xylaria sp. FL0064]